ncbi:FMN-binding protein, partial [Streptomyces sp. NPDC057877]|uniref:FMN-binding protein n=1 Tax=Streptomyces sp. NPDC057877 TaxID=3346269 RepID=UPI0036A9F477
KITQAQAVQAPDSDATNDALPQLNQAAVTAGSADIDAVSGATYTSKGYQQSLQSAVDQMEKADAEQPGSGQQARTVTGEVAQTQYGPVQVRITVEGGKITQAQAVQAPDSDATNDALPQLNQAAVTAGNADIDAVSGATYTSKGYQQSLQSALDQAGG